MCIVDINGVETAHGTQTSGMYTFDKGVLHGLSRYCYKAIMLSISMYAVQYLSSSISSGSSCLRIFEYSVVTKKILLYLYIYIIYIYLLCRTDFLLGIGLLLTTLPSSLRQLVSNESQGVLSQMFGTSHQHTILWGCCSLVIRQTPVAPLPTAQRTSLGWVRILWAFVGGIGMSHCVWIWRDIVPTCRMPSTQPSETSRITNYIDCFEGWRCNTQYLDYIRYYWNTEETHNEVQHNIDWIEITDCSLRRDAIEADN